MHYLGTAPVGGVISKGIDANAFAWRTIEFVEAQLPLWRDDPNRPNATAEEELNGQLCKFLNDRARDHFPMAFFHHEEKQGARRRVDMSVLPSSGALAAVQYSGTIYEPFLVMEGKRLPTPTAARKREYITGITEQSGGIQRFKLCLHGADHSIAVMIGYIQQKNEAYWEGSLNTWISELATSCEDTTCSWSANDLLSKSGNSLVLGRTRRESNHDRVGRPGIGPVKLIHLWVSMQ